jgi:hypothetical protein
MGCGCGYRLVRVIRGIQGWNGDGERLSIPEIIIHAHKITMILQRFQDPSGLGCGLKYKYVYIKK